MNENNKDTFNYHFKRLEQHANRLQQANVDIDQLENMIRESKESKSFCEQRIEAVRQSLNSLLDVTPELTTHSKE